MADIDLDDVEDAIRTHPDPVVKANEISDELGCTSRHVLDLLRLLERAGAVESKQIGARAVAWWHVDCVVTNESQQTDESIVSEQPTNHERTNQRGNNEGTANESSEIEEVVEQVAAQWSDSPERIEQRKQAVRAALELLQEQPMSKSEILDEVEPSHPVDGQSPRTWWRANLAECDPSPLKQLAEYRTSTKKWVWIGE